MTDTGYLGLQTFHKKTSMPKKTQPKQRVPCEHVIGALKRFKIVADKDRNRRKRFGLRFSLIAGLYNANLTV